MSGGHDLMIRTGRCLVVSKTVIVHELGLLSSSLAIDSYKVSGDGTRAWCCRGRAGQEEQ
jgi:hypothetical protein